MPQHILLIDDDAQVRQTFRAILEREGYRVSEAEDGIGGLSAFEADPSDLLIVDIIMPKESGVETIRRVRELAPNVPIIAMSGGGRTADLRFLALAGKLGATRTMIKPVRAAELLQEVQTCLRSP